MSIKKTTGRKTGVQDESLAPKREGCPRRIDWDGSSSIWKSELFLLIFFFCILFLKPFYSSSGIQKFLFPGEKRMTVRADFYMDILFCALRLKRRSAGAFYHRVKNLGVHLFFHRMASRLSFYFTDFPQIFNYFLKIQGLLWVIVIV
jgi:hypothetical protein